MTDRYHLPRASLAMLLGLCLALAGCGALNDALGGGEDPSRPIGDEPAPPGVPPVDGPPPGDGATFVEPDPEIREAAPQAIERFVVGPDGRSVVVYWWGGVDNCFGLQRVDVDTAGETPVITVFEGGRPEAEGQACIMIAVLKATVVQLDRPILVDAHGDATPPGPPGLALDGAQPASVDPAAGNRHPTAVVGYQLSADGRSLGVAYVGGTPECYAPAEVLVDEDARPPTVAVWEGSFGGDQPCIDIGILKMVEVELSAPLLVDGSLARG
jgi:hypothetical protein